MARPALVARAACAVLLAAGAASLDGQTPEPGTLERRAASVALGAKLLCSGVFVAGREPGPFIRRDLDAPEYTFHDWATATVAVDPGQRRVTVEAPGLAARTAVFTGDQGCVLLPLLADDVFFVPEEVRAGAPVDDSGWPEHAAAHPLAPDTRQALDSVLARAVDDGRQPVPQDTRALVVLQGDRIVGEAYAPGFGRDSRHISWSMGKSLASALVGVLVGEGRLAPDDPAPIPLWRRPGDPRAAITVADLLRMSGGLAFESYGVDDPEYYTARHHHEFVYYGAVDVLDFVLHRPLRHPPGSHWAYRNANTLALVDLVRRAALARGGSHLAFPYHALLGPIGADRMVLETDPYGHFILTGFVYGSAMDWARFGLLHLQDGVWDGERILPAGWVDFVRTPAPAHPTEGYGAQFWLNAGGRYPSWPDDAFWALGWLGQIVVVVPSRDVVVVRLGHSARGGFDAYIEPLVAELLDVLEREPVR